MRVIIRERFCRDLWAEVVTEGSHQLRNSLNVVVLRADKAQCTLPWVLPKASHTEQRRGDRSEVLRVALTPDTVLFGNIDARVEVFFHKLFLELRQIVGLRLYRHLDLLCTETFHLDAVVRIDAFKHSLVRLWGGLPPVETLPIEKSVFQMELCLFHCQREYACGLLL